MQDLKERVTELEQLARQYHEWMCQQFNWTYHHTPTGKELLARAQELGVISTQEKDNVA